MGQQVNIFSELNSKEEGEVKAKWKTLIVK